MRLVIWGAGELGGRVGSLWAQRGAPVVGLTRSVQRHEALHKRGIMPRVGSAAELLVPDDALLLALPGHANSQAAVQTLADTQPPWRAVLISSTGYYGTAHGRVDEETPRGRGARAEAIEATELAFRTWAGTRGVIVRLAGLYSQDRGPFAALLRRGTVRLGPPDRTLALIHYDDAATATLAALCHASPEPTYVGVVPPCPTRREFYQQACLKAGLPEPAFTARLGLQPAMYDSTRLQRDLLPEPAQPHWQAALRC